MQHEWMIDVLTDLRTFAQNHQLDRLAEHLDDAVVIAASEMVRGSDEGIEGAEDYKTGTVHRGTGTGAIY